MSHELRTPLNAIIGFAEVMRLELLGPLGSARYREYINDIHDCGQHLLSLIDDVLDMSRIEAGRFELHEERCHLPHLVASALRLVRERAAGNGLGLAESIEPGVPSLYADHRAVKQILLNLLSNAIKFTPAGGSVSVQVGTTRDGGIVIAIVDSGIGMAPEDIPKALEAFGQVDSSLSRKYEGTGLGLPLSKALIELHGGRLEIASAPGQGTTVSACFPATRVGRPSSAA